jgi:hypothetical protein
VTDRVILRFGDDEDEYSCGEDDCVNRWRCVLHGARRDDIRNRFRPAAELVIAGVQGTLTCRDYEKGEGDGGMDGR